jgi:hypothetical protein
MSTIVTRAGKGSPLTHTEVDSNFTNLNTDKYQSGNNASFGTLSASGAFSANGGTTLGDASGDALTINSSAVSIPNGLNFDSNTLVIDATNNVVGVGNNIAGTMESNNGSGTLVVGSGSGSKGMTIFSGSTSGSEARLTFANDSSGAGAYAAQITYKSGDNAVLFYNQNAERMRITSAGNVGIGTSSPTRTLDVTGASPLRLNTTANNQLLMAINGTAHSQIYSNATYALGVTDGGATGTFLYLTQTGNLGLGVTPSAWALSGSQAIQVKNASLAGYVNTAYLNANTYFNSGGGANYIANGFAGQYTIGNGSHVWYNAPSGTAGNAITFTQAMTLDASGNLGIGATSPSNRLTVVGTGSLFGTTGYINTEIVQENTTNKKGIILGYDSSGQIGIIGANSGGVASNLAFWNYNGSAWGERMRIDSSGNVLINTTTVNGQFSVETAAANTNVASFKMTNASGPNYGFVLASSSSAANTVALFRGYNSGTTLCFNIGGDGTVTNSTGTYGTISDARLKENIVDATSKLDKVMELKVRNFNLIGDELKQIGFIAQEIEQVFPSLVEETVDIDSENNDLGTTTKSVKTTVLIPILVKAIQELNAKVTALEAQLNK